MKTNDYENETKSKSSSSYKNPEIMGDVLIKSSNLLQQRKRRGLTSHLKYMTEQIDFVILIRWILFGTYRNFLFELRFAVKFIGVANGWRVADLANAMNNVWTIIRSLLGCVVKHGSDSTRNAGSQMTNHVLLISRYANSPVFGATLRNWLAVSNDLVGV